MNEVLRRLEEIFQSNFSKNELCYNRLLIELCRILIDMRNHPFLLVYIFSIIVHNCASQTLVTNYDHCFKSVQFFICHLSFWKIVYI